MECYISEAKEWVSSNQGDNKIKYSVNEESNPDNRVTISATCPHLASPLVFFVTCPVNNQTEEQTWGAWSDDELLQPHLQIVIEFCESARNKSIKDVLHKIDEVIKKISDEDDDDDDDDDDGYDDDDDDGCDYYGNEEVLPAENTAKPDDDEEDDDDIQETFFGAGVSPVAFQRLAKDMRNMKKEAHKFGIEGNPRGDNLFIWDVKLTDIPKDTPLGKDIVAWAEKYKREAVVYLEMQFPGDYPMSPPFVRVTRPRFKFLTGHVTIGGSICMEMLTKSGWTPTNDIEIIHIPRVIKVGKQSVAVKMEKITGHSTKTSILVQIRSEILSDPKTRLDHNPDTQYSADEAKKAFDRMVHRYGWDK